LLTPLRQIKISLITAPEFNLDYLWWLTILFLVLSIVYFVGVFIIRNRITSNNSRTKEKKVEFSPMINEFLFYEDSNTKEEKMNYLNLKIQIRESIKNKFDRHVLTEVLLDLRKDLSGQSQTVLIDLYKDLGLHHDAYEKLGSSKWQIVSSGILELTTMEVNEAYGLVLKFINHRQSTIRKQAEIAVVNLKEEGIKYFLDNTKYKIAEWQQLKLLDVLRHKPNYTPPQFGLWLTSTNTQVVLFSLRLIKYYSQNDAEQSITTLLKHKKRDIQAEAIECIKIFHFVNALPTLKLVYPKASRDIKIAILDAIGEIGSTADVPFLENLKSTEKHFNIKSKVFSTLNKINPESVLPTKNISNAAFYDVEINVDSQETVSELHESQEELLTNIATAKSSLNTENKETVIEETFEVVSRVEKAEVDKVEETRTKEIHQGTISNEVEFVQEEPKEAEMTDEIDSSLLLHIKNDVAITKNSVDVENIEKVEHLDKVKEDFTFNFLPFVVEVTSIEEQTPSFIQEDFEPLFELEGEFIANEQEVPTVIGLEQSLTDEIDEIDWSSLDKVNVEKKEVAIEASDSDEPIISFENGEVTFSASFMPQAELETMVILENISELGNSLELDLLHEIIEENSSELIKERANELIQKFSYKTPLPNQLFDKENDLSESVFTDIYHLADLETKLILLNEIKDVGDAKEIYLIESIIESESKKLAKVAIEALNEIKSRVVLTTEELRPIANDPSIFDVNFKLESSESPKIRLASTDNGSTLFDQLCSMSHSLYNKING